MPNARISVSGSGPTVSGDTKPNRFVAKVVVVTGSTQGLGAAVAHRLSAEGAEGLIVTGRDRDRGETVTAELIAHGTDARFVAADMALADAPSAVVDFAEETFGRIDVLVNCAAITDRDTIWDSTPTFFDRMIAINTGAPLFMMQETARVMRREGTEGTMVNVLSTSAHGGNRSSCLTAEPRGRWQP